MKNKIWVLVVVFSMLICSGNLIAKERRGAELLVQKKDGQQIRGELVAVKQASLLLIDSKTGNDVSARTEEIAVVKIIKKSKGWIGGILGFAVGGFLGMVAISGEEATIADIAVVFGGAGALIGAGFGALLGKDDAIQFGGRSQQEVRAIMGKLRSKARVPNFQ